MNATFSYCSKITSIPQIDTSKVIDMEHAFSNCANLTSIPQIDTSKVIDMLYIFANDTNLTHIRFNPNANNIVDFDISYCKKMTREDIIGMFESLPTISKKVTITLNTTQLEKLTDEDKLIATNKGYTLV